MAFYVPENPDYTIFDSVADSLRFTMTRCLTACRGHACATSTFVDPEGEVMVWHDFGLLEGPGWAANAVGGAYELIKWGRLTADAGMVATAGSILDHVLENGFIDGDSGFIYPYRHTAWDRTVLNFKHNDAWLCPGSQAKVAVQMLQCGDLDDARGDRLRQAAVGFAKWLDFHVPRMPNGWFPRRVTPGGRVYDQKAEGGPDPFVDGSADGLFILQLWSELTARGLVDYRDALVRGIRVFQDAGGIYGSINHDTYDGEETVACSVAARVLRQAGVVLEDPSLAGYTRQSILPKLDKYKMSEDRNGVATQGLLYMEDSWDTSYMWENAEAALAYFEAYTDTGKRGYALDGLTILRATAKHHHGEHGFLTEGVDWNNHVSDQHHFGYAEFGDIRYTEPFLNNQHIAEPTLYYLEHLAEVEEEGTQRVYRDIEENVIATLSE